jgi:hypothetical protein
MSFTPNHNLEKSAQGVVRFDSSINANADTIDTNLPGGAAELGENLAQQAQAWLVGWKTGVAEVWKFENTNVLYPVGFIDASAGALSDGDTVYYQSAGRLAGFTGLTIGGLVYADPDTPGDITQTKPGMDKNPTVVGVAKSATEIEIISGYKEDDTIIKGGSNTFIKAGTSSITGEGTVNTSGFSSISSVICTISGGGASAYEPTLNEMGVRAYVTGANAFKIFVSKLDGTSIGRWVQGTTARTIYWVAVGTPA